MWLVLHHSLPCKYRLFERGHPGVLTPHCPHHPQGIHINETISHVIFCRTTRPIWAWSLHFIFLVSGTTTMVNKKLLGVSDEVLSRLVFTDWRTAVPEPFQTFWAEVICITLYCIVNSRNTLSLDQVCITEPRAARSNLVRILKRLVFEIRRLVSNKFAALRRRENIIANSKMQDSYVKSILEFQKSYLGQSHIGSLDRGDEAGTYKIVLAPIPDITFPRSFELKDRFYNTNVWATRLRGKTAARTNPPPGAPSFLPPEGIT